MSLLDTDDPHSPPAAHPPTRRLDPRRARRFGPGAFAAALLPLGLAAVAFTVWHWLAVWGQQGLDFSVYWHGGKILNDASQAPSDLYRGNIDWAGGPALQFTYPPFAALLFSLLARLPEKAALNLFNTAGVTAALWLAARAVRYWTAKANWGETFRTPSNAWAAAVMLLAVLNLGPWRETLAFGQINILLMGVMAADLLARNPRWTRGVPGNGFLVGIAAGIKLTPLVFGLYFLVRKDWRGLLNMAAGFFATVLVGGLLLPAESLQFWLHSLLDTSRIGGAGYVDNLSLKGALLHFGVPEAAVTGPWLVLSLLVVALAAGIIKTASDQGARMVAISTTALTMLLISPISWSHHWVWVAMVFPAFAWTLRQTPRRYRGTRWMMGGVLGISVLVFLFSPKTIGTAFGAQNLDLQTPVPWIMASSAGVFCAVALMLCWLLALRRGSVVSRSGRGRTARGPWRWHCPAADSPPDAASGRLPAR